MQAHVISDQELIGKYLAGHESALEKLILRHKNRVFAYVLMVVKDKELAEDLFNLLLFLPRAFVHRQP